MYYELQPLRIQAGWRVEYNNFSEYDLDTHGEEDAYELNEDLLLLYNEKANLEEKSNVKINLEEK